MTEIRFVVLSDLHFGALNSVLTSARPSSAGGTEPNHPDVVGAGPYECDPACPSPLLEAVLAGLRALVAGQATPPTLVLAGDVLDLALSSDAVACTAFEGFVDLAFAGPNRLFGPNVYYLPGNHDHHLWEGAREAQYIQYIESLAPNVAIEEPWHTTALLPASHYPSATDLMSALFKRRPGCSDVTVQVVYPNLALVSPDGRRTRIVSHGHYTEPIYTMMTALKDLLFPEQIDPSALPSIAQMEAENFAWIDFFWSTLGRSGEVGVDVGLVYADLSSAADLDQLAGNLARSLVLRNHGPHWLRPLELRLSSSVARREAKHLARSERGTPDQVLSPKSEAGLRGYLGGPVRQQLLDEMGKVGDDVGFIFGHTHKPFVEDREIPGFPQPVQIANTGGWVVDTPGPALTQGGVAVLLDEALNTASLEFYRQTPDGGSAPVSILAPAEAGVNPLHDWLAARIDPGAEPWSQITQAAAELVRQRHQIQAALMKATD